MDFDWDEANRSHIARHRGTAEEAEQVFVNGPLELDQQVVAGEERFSQVGETNAGRILVVVATWRDSIRVVAAWDAPQATKRRYLTERFSQWHPRS